MINLIEHTQHSEQSPISTEKKRVVIDSRQLFNASNEVIIQHHGSEYHLRITSNDKLILTK